MMKNTLAIDPVFDQFNLPLQDLDELDFCHSSKPAKVLAWINSLPATRANHTSVLLYQALPQIARLKTTPAKRIEILEHFRPVVQQCITSLSKEFLNQPIILPEAPLKTAIVAQALQKNMCNGYTLSALEFMASDKPDLTQMAHAIHRSISGLGLILLRSYQLYTQTPSLIWLQIHTLLATARHKELSNHSVLDPLLIHSRGCTIEQAYNRLLLLACSNPNQLRQNDINHLYEAMEIWAPLCSLQAAEGSNQLFMVNLRLDKGPTYAKRYTGTFDENCLALDTRNLLLQFDKHRSGEKFDNANFDRYLNRTLLNQIVEGLRTEKRRRNERQPSTGEFEVCVGLTSIHKELTGGLDFKEFLAQGGQKKQNLDYDAFMAKPLSSEHDPWAEAFDAGPKAGNRHIGSSPSRNSSAKAGEQLHKVTAHDKSSGGYCIRWKDQTPLQVKAGELIGLRQPGRRSWQLAVIRWIAQQRGSTVLGLELLATNAQPIAISMTHKTGDESDYMRGLKLPEQTLPKQQESVITPALPFTEKAKVNLLTNGEARKAQLNKCLFNTSSINQFTLNYLETNEPAKTSTAPEKFKSDW